GHVEIDPITSYCDIYEVVTSKSESSRDYLLYPNPGNGKLTLKTPNIEPLYIRIYNVLGSLVYMKQTENSLINKIDISNNPDGVYLLQISSSDDSFTSKLIIE
ncbi:MAG TPA: T9SS type A sorting domain-containing protein, partial [Flavobacteriales bacterium]|nr:T9SS type A sorting domain-containing protein [Flavobacteriales bacterium]